MPTLPARTAAKPHRLASADLIALAALQRLRDATAPNIERPDGFQTVNEIADAWNLSRERASELLLRGLAAGLWERRKWGRFYVWREIRA